MEDQHGSIFCLAKELARLKICLLSVSVCVRGCSVRHLMLIVLSVHFAFYLVNFGIPFGSHPIKSALARHTGVQVPLVPAKVIT